MNVLIVDDEEDIRNSLQQYLKLDGIDGDVAENGLSAQRILREKPYDAVLVDLKMPGMDGQQLIEWLRKEGYRMPVIMMS
ncbi:MAG: response regulator, partial [Sphaerochaeta sp.]|nr:response regulator [Sphaerochaeta sp.]